MKFDYRTLANAGVKSITPYQPGKPVEEVERELGITSAIKLASNENPLGASANAIAIGQKILSQAHIYPDGSYYELKQVLSRFLSVEPLQITVGNGSENVLELIVKTFLNENTQAIISQYAFATIPILIASYNAKLTIVPAKNYAHDIDAIINAITEQTRIIFLVNPNNPTGTYFNETEFTKLMQATPSNVLVVMDEAYCEYISKPDYPDTLSHLQQYPNLVITRTFSKVYGLAALRLGYAITSLEIADLLNRARLPFNVNTIVAKMAIAALEDQEHIIKSVLLNQTGMRYIEECLSEMRVKYIPSIGNFITIDVGQANPVYQQLLQEGIIVRPLNAYKLANFIRVTIGTKEQNKLFIQALQKTLKTINYQTSLDTVV